MTGCGERTGMAGASNQSEIEFIEVEVKTPRWAPSLREYIGVEVEHRVGVLPQREQPGTAGVNRTVEVRPPPEVDPKAQEKSGVLPSPELPGAATFISGTI